MPNLLKEKNKENITDASIYQTAQQKKKSSLIWRSLIVLLLIIILIGLGFLTKAVLAINSTNQESGEKISFFEQKLFHFLLFFFLVLNRLLT